MSPSFSAKEPLLFDSAERQRQQVRASVMAELDEELSMFLEMTRREKEQPGSKPGTSAVFHISSGGAPARKAPAPDHFLNSQGYNEWTTMSQTGGSKSCPGPATLTSRLANSSTEPAARNHLTSRQPTSSLGLSSSSGASRRPLSSGGPGSRPAIPSGRSSTPTLQATISSTTRSSMTNSRSTVSATAKRTPMSGSTSSSRLKPTASKPATSTAR